jgi:hypothetical protein
VQRHAHAGAWRVLHDERGVIKGVEFWGEGDKVEIHVYDLACLLMDHEDKPFEVRGGPYAEHRVRMERERLEREDD